MPTGPTQVFFTGWEGRISDGQAKVLVKGVKRSWVRKHIIAPAADLFMTKQEATEEYRRRKAEARAREAA